MRRRPGIQGRLNAVQAQAQQAISRGERAAVNIEAAVLGLIDELRDGVTLEVKIGGRLLPIEVRIRPEEEAGEG